MKIFVICSKKFYDRVPDIKDELESKGHMIELPNCFDKPETESSMRDQGKDIHAKWKSEMILHSTGVIDSCDAVLVLNFEKNGQQNYIGGATFLEMYDAFRLGKKIYIYNDIPEGMLKDEIIGFQPIVLNGDLEMLN